MTGTVTNVCCESSARDASTLGYRVVMVADLNVGGDLASRSSTFTVVYRTFGDVRTSAEVTALFDRPTRPPTRAGRPTAGRCEFPQLPSAAPNDDR